MRPFTGDIQILLYTEEEKFSACRDFYQTLLRQEPYYSWNEGDAGLRCKIPGWSRHNQRTLPSSRWKNRFCDNQLGD